MPFLLLLGLWLIAEMIIFVICLFKLGFWITIALMLLSSTIGTLIVRQQRVNMATMLQMPNDKYNARNGVYQFTAGMLLTIPGFLSSLIGIIFLTPPLRRVIGAGLLRIFRPQVVADAFFNFQGGETEYTHKSFMKNAQKETNPQEVTATREDGTIIQGELVDDGKK